MLRKKKFGIASLCLLLVSCTIVKDSDVTSLTQYNQLKLQSFDFNQDLNSGSLLTSGSLKYDSAKNFVNAFGYHINRRVGYSLPSLGTKKLQLRCGINSPTLLRITYRDDGKPFSLEIDNPSNYKYYEFYRFLYNTKGQLAKVLTVIPKTNPVDTLSTGDSLIYETGGALKSFTRNKGPGFSSIQTNSAGAGQYLSHWVWNGVNYEVNSGNCNNDSGDPTLCGKVFISGQTQTGFNPNIDVAHVTTLGKTTQTTLTDDRFSNGGNQCDCTRELDTFYFHPFMLLHDVVPQGKEMLQIYSIDWWKYGTAQTSGTSLSKSDQVIVKFNYAK